MNFIKRYFSRRRNRKRSERDCYLRSLVEVTERCGQIWITCDERAVFCFDCNAKASTISEIAERMRSASIAYDKHEPFYVDDNENTNPTVVFNINNRNEDYDY